MIYLVLGLMCVVFVELVIRMGLSGLARSIIGESREALAVIGSPTLSDDQKQVSVRRSALTLLAASLKMGAKLVLIALVLGAIGAGAARMLAVSEQQMFASMLSPVGLLALTVAGLLYLRIRHAVHQRLQHA
ncbi:hypothetical protein [Alkalilimnicola sp. S0819]|uniref:hypothetical protein n=1 Tax=Alkalilimnicola sp. S0819 TaxID=2613922 RepID=UPI001262543E|nr:hypothetical protein [Alkalilimnicola sp. S0819]KAB7619690.1 hypothetical protein F3N43_12980 [Alkalilimnicola sp. S0819]MPQ17547.1 hypothetical protein [Alkalilimnicola sp. S0819]